MPANSGFTNVKADSGAKDDGIADDTDALEKAVGSPAKEVDFEVAGDGKLLRWEADDDDRPMPPKAPDAPKAEDF